MSSFHDQVSSLLPYKLGSPYLIYMYIMMGKSEKKILR